MSTRAATPTAPPAPKPRATAPPWFRWVLTLMAGVYLMGLFSTASGDSDMWWHLRSGKYIWENHRLPVPDPFAYTTDSGTPVYSGELTTRHFNLTHEWGMELIYYLVQSKFGFPGLVLFRAFLLTFFCGITGWLTWRRSGSYYRGLAAAVYATTLAILFASDRAFLATFVLVPLTVAAFETRRCLWLLPPTFLVWANLHGGFVMGWAVAGVYSAEALYLWYRGKPLADERKVWTVSTLSVLASLLNPNGLGVLAVMLHYRDSPLQLSISEWNYPAWWPPDFFNLLMVGTAVVLLWAGRRARLRDWLLFLVLGTSAAMALRNVIFIAFVGPMLLATYIPVWKREVPAILEYPVAAFFLFAIGIGIAHGRTFELRMDDYRYPKGAVDFLREHGIRGRLFNTYEAGGYLMWRLWPDDRVFIDGRALNEQVWNDYIHIAFNADYQGGKTTQQLLDSYGVDVIVMNGFDYKGQLYYLPAALADPVQKKWKLVFADPKAVIFMRTPPPDVKPLPSLDALTGLENQCTFNVKMGLAPRCAQSLADTFMKIGDWKRGREWAKNYLLVDSQDAKALAMLQWLDAHGK